MVVVYKTPRESVNIIIKFLREEGFNPIPIDDSDLAYDRRNIGLHIVNIEVPREQAAGASAVLKKWDQSRQPEVSKSTKQLVKPFLLSTFFVLTLAGVFLFFGILLETAALLFVLWLITFTVLANFERIVRKHDTKHK